MDCLENCPLPECPKMAAKVKGIIQCSAKCGSDFACRSACNVPVTKFVEMCSNFHKTEFEHFKPPPGHVLVSKFRACHDGCAGDAECIQKCPKPFWMKFKKTCEEAIPIMECHQKCGCDHACHENCPVPSCPHMKAQVEESMRCHGQCQDRECHHACPKPMKAILSKCQVFEKVQQCHGNCTDFNCHHECPKAHLWHFLGHHDFGFHH
ncbi:PTC1, partial [Symbiodinium pilosum]